MFSNDSALISKEELSKWFLRSFFELSAELYKTNTPPSKFIDLIILVKNSEDNDYINKILNNENGIKNKLTDTQKKILRENDIKLEGVD